MSAALLAKEAFAAALAATEGKTDPASALVRARALSRTGETDAGLLEARKLLRRAAELSEDERAQAWALVVELYGARRCGPLAQKAWDDAVAACGEAPLLQHARGRALLSLDQRPEAEAMLAASVAKQRTGAATVTLAHARYVLGHFQDALDEVAKVPDGDAAELAALRLRAQVQGARGEHAAEAETLAKLVQAAPESDWRVSDRVALAVAYATLERLADAKAELEWVAKQDKDPGAARYARTRIGFLDRATDAKRRVLAAFPTTHQKRNHCGPAVLELCARYLGFDLDPDVIAKQVRRGEGTPMFEITRFLAEHAIAHRRAVMDDERLKKAIDLGFPVILQEEYSTTSHVAVVTGYDDRLGVFVVTDPMTHHSGTRPYGWNDHAGELFGCGVVVVLGREGPETDEKAKGADAAGIVDAAHLRLMDEADRTRPSGLSGETNNSVHELIVTATRAIAAEPDFRLAWLRRTGARLEVYRRTRNEDAQDEFLADLYEVRTRFPNDEWPHQIHARYLDYESRYSESAAMWSEALRVDPGDGNNACSLGAMKFFTGDLAGAKKTLWRALSDFAHPGEAEGLLAGAYLRELELRAADRAKDAQQTPAVPWAVSRFPETARARIEDETDEDLLFSAWHMNELQRAFDPENPTAWDVAGYLALAERDAAKARPLFEKAAPNRARAERGLACALEHAGEYEGAEKLLASVARQYPRHVESQTDLASFFRRRGVPERAAQHLEASLDRASPPEDLVYPLYDALRVATSSEEACARLRALAEERSNDWGFLMTAVDRLESAAWGGHAIALLRQLVDKAPKDAGLLTRLGRLLLPDPFARDEAMALLERSAAVDPGYYWTARSLALGFVGRDPEKGLHWAEKAIAAAGNGPQLGYALETKSRLLAALGRADEADKTLRRAPLSWPSQARGMRALIYFHLDQTSDYARALELVKLAPPVDDDDEGGHWLWAYELRASRLVGRGKDALARAKEIWERTKLRSDLGWDVYWTTHELDRPLARAAAEWQRDHAETTDGREDWERRAAEMEAHMGDASHLDRLRDAAAAKPKTLSHLYWVYADLGRHDDAIRVARDAYEKAPTDDSVATAACEAELSAGDAAKARAIAERLTEDRPFAHAGFERLALVTAMQLDADAALAASARAVESAPGCSVAQRSYAAALFAKGDRDGAAARARWAIALDPPNANVEARWEVGFLAALEGKKGALDPYLAKQSPDAYERKAPYLDKLR